MINVVECCIWLLLAFNYAISVNAFAPMVLSGRRLSGTRNYNNVVGKLPVRSTTKIGNQRLLLLQQQQQHQQQQNLVRNMYNLPGGTGGSGPGGSGDGENTLQQIATGALTILGLVAFFASPLGGIFFAITNSILALAILTPLVLVVVFQVWQFFNTMEGTCPNCGAPSRCLKDESPNICFNCGTLIKASSDGTTIEFVNTGSTDDVVIEDGTVRNTNPMSIFDQMFASFEEADTTTPQEKANQYRRDQTIIDIVDVEVTKDDKSK